MRGFTAIELMVTLAILAVLAALAAPSFTPIVERWRVRQAVDGFQSTLYFARSEAIKRGGNVVIEKLANNGSCTTAPTANDWGCGWLVCEDSNSDGTCSATEPVLQRYETAPRLEVSRTSGGAQIQFNRWGMVAGSWIGVTIVPQGKSVSDPAARGVCVSSAGRVRVEPNPPCISG